MKSKKMLDMTNPDIQSGAAYGIAMVLEYIQRGAGFDDLDDLQSIQDVLDELVVNVKKQLGSVGERSNQRPAKTPTPVMGGAGSSPAATANLAGKFVGITGKLNRFVRSDFENWLTSKGAIFTNTPHRANIFVVGHTTAVSRKVSEAALAGAEVLSETQFFTKYR